MTGHRQMPLTSLKFIGGKQYALNTIRTVELAVIIGEMKKHGAIHIDADGPDRYGPDLFTGEDSVDEFWRDEFWEVPGTTDLGENV